MVDKNTAQKIGLSFAKLLVKVQIEKTLPKCIYFKKEKGQIIEQRIIYDWKTTICGKCKKYRHSTEVCRKNKEKEAVATKDKSKEEGEKVDVTVLVINGEGSKKSDVNVQPKEAWVQVAGQQNQNIKPTQTTMAKLHNETQLTGRGYPTGKQTLNTSNCFQ